MRKALRKILRAKYFERPAESTIRVVGRRAAQQLRAARPSALPPAGDDSLFGFGVRRRQFRGPPASHPCRIDARIHSRRAIVEQVHRSVIR